MSRDKSPISLNVDSDNVRNLIRKRGIIKSRLTKFSSYLQSLEKIDFKFNVKNHIDLKLRIQGAASLFSEFNDIQTKIEESVSDDSLSNQLDQRDSFEHSYYSTLAHAESMLEPEEITDNSHKSCHNSQLQSVKLPTISMPTFDGAYEHWLEFRDTFLSLVHNSKDISSIQKFHYLKSSLKGSAQLVIDSIEFSAANYIVAWDLLLSRYNNSRLLVQNHVKALFTIIPITKESPHLLRKLGDTILKKLRSLNILGEPTDSWDTLINYIIVSKLDKITEREWESYKSTLISNNTDPTPRAIKVDEMILFLKNRADMLESLQLSHNKDLGNENKKSFTSKSLNTSYCNISTDKPRGPRYIGSCLKCNAKHPLYSCTKFIESDLSSKLKFVRERNLCVNCLRSGHTVDSCKFGTCRKCNLKHNTLLHNHNNSTVTFHSPLPAKHQTETLQASAGASAPSPSAIDAVPADILPVQVNKAHMQKGCNMSVGIQSVLLSTAIVEASDVHGSYHKVRVLLDSGSQRCFISESLSQLLNAPLIQSTNQIRGVGDSVIHCSKTCNIEIKSCVDATFQTTINCFVLKEITSTMPTVCKLGTELRIPPSIQLADPEFLYSKNIDILIGADRFWDLLCDGRIRLPNGPYLQNTKLGWVVSGPIFNNLSNSKHIQCNVSSSDILNKQLKMFWEIEEILQVRDAQTEEERACEDHFVRTTTRNNEGRFCVRIPLNQSPDILGDSYNQAERQFLSLERRLNRSPDYKSLYINFMREYIQLGHMSKIDIYAHPCYFMPHHGVFREHSTTTKLRVVFNASSPSSTGKSFNDLQLVGPPIQGDLLAILLRFRQHKFVVCADIEKMYRQCLIDESQRNLQLIVWREDPSQPLGIYRLNTVTYGTASAPFLSIRCLKQLAVESSDPEVKKVINEDFFVDDLITGLDDKNRLLDLCTEIKRTLERGCLPLRKWIYSYNFKCDEDILLHEKCKELSLDENFGSKTLGMGWSSVMDEIYFNTLCTLDDKPVTKRNILSITSQIYDPLGLLSPIIIVAKVLLQKLWLLKLEWDDLVPSNVAREWHQFIVSMQDLGSIRVPRRVIGIQPKLVELHVFSDASQTAYGACVYVRTINNDHTISIHLIMSKTKVAPLKPLSVPRLELCGALVGARLYVKVNSSLRRNFDRIVFWTDSTIVLGWLKMSPNRLKTFVQNRIAEIRELTEDLPWYHVNSRDNPADLASRGVNLNYLSSSRLWWQGPEFLQNPDFSVHDLNQTNIFQTVENQLPEIKSVVSMLVNHNSYDVTFFPFTRFSQFNRMKRTMAYTLRFIHNIRFKLSRRTGPLSDDELRLAQIILVKLSQIESYPVEYNQLLKNKCIKRKNNLSKLSLFMDDNHIIRVGGRLEYSEFDFNKRHPVLLSSKHYFTYLLFRHEHVQLLHAGPQALLCHLRETWWPTGGRNLCRKIVHQCITCTRLRGKTLTPLMGNLPKERVTPGYPFIRCGVDYGGPVLILNRKGKGARTNKGYICLFICFVTRAIHLELVTDLSSQAYLLALKRFISRRGKPLEIFCDNGRNFVGLMNEFSNFLLQCSPDIVEYATSQQIKFNFIPCYASHFGGLWESGIKSCKYHLRRVVGNAHLTFEEFSTVLIQIEAVLNSRPLSPLSSDPKDLTPLTPAHFLIGRPLTAPACDDLREVPDSRLQRYQRVEQIRQHFWSRWAKEYVSEMQIRSKWRENKDELKVGTLVVVKDDNLPPLKWQMGRVIRTIPGKDGISRVADIHTSSGTIRRAFVKICPLFNNEDIF